MNKKTLFKKTTVCVIFAFITALFAQIEISLPYVPISGQTLAVGLTATILGSRPGALSMTIYVLAGILGAPVFTGFDSGLNALTGPTGGYIIGFIIAAYVTGKILETQTFTITIACIANLVGMIIILAIGMMGLKYNASMSWVESLRSGVYPFLLTGVIKALLAGWLGIILRNKAMELELRELVTK